MPPTLLFTLLCTVYSIRCIEWFAKPPHSFFCENKGVRTTNLSIASSHTHKKILNEQTHTYENPATATQQSRHNERIVSSEDLLSPYVAASAISCTITTAAKHGVVTRKHASAFSPSRAAAAATAIITHTIACVPRHEQKRTTATSTAATIPHE